MNLSISIMLRRLNLFCTDGSISLERELFPTPQVCSLKTTMCQTLCGLVAVYIKDQTARCCRNGETGILPSWYLHFYNSVHIQLLTGMTPINLNSKPLRLRVSKKLIAVIPCSGFNGTCVCTDSYIEHLAASYWVILEQSVNFSW